MSFLQRDVHAVSGEVKPESYLGRNDLDHDAVLVLQVHDGAAPGHRDAGARSDIVAGEVGQRLKVVDAPGGREVRRAYIDNRDPFDRKLVGVVLILELTAAPALADSDGHAAALQRPGAIRLRILGDRGG